jgi:hypothetical protein
MRGLQGEPVHRRADRADREDLRQACRAQRYAADRRLLGAVVRAVPYDGAFDKAAKELEPRARFAKVNVDEEPAIAARFDIRGIPTLIAFEKGKVAKQHSGLVDLNFLKGLAHTD